LWFPVCIWPNFSSLFELRNSTTLQEMSTFNPLSIRAFVGRSQLQRKSRARFRVAAGMLLSLLLHAALLFYALSVNVPPPIGASSSVPPAPLMVTLLPSKPKPSAKAPSPTPPEPKRTVTPPKPKAHAAVKRPAPPKPAPRPTAPPVTDTARAMPPAPAADMSTMLEAARARRQTAEAAAASENALARENDRPPSGNEIAQANINFQMHKNQGVSGVFQILNVGPRVAQFLFVGWTNDARDSRRQTITVDAGMNGDVQLAIIDRMIELIRVHYSGDFNWDSRRLGRVVVLSARKSDQEDLRRFMMREFFESGR
jgi:hypothetical protein